MSEFASKSLDKVKVFRQVSPEGRAELAKKCNWRSYSPQEFILDRDHEDADIYFIIRGVIRVVNYGLNGKEVSYADIQEGECFGELSAIDGKARSAAIIALEPTHVASMKPAALREAMKDYPEVAIALLEKVTSMVRGASERVLELSTLGANNRVFGEILRLCRVKLAAMPPEHQHANRVVLSPAPIHTDIAARVSTTRETVARSFGILTRQKILRRIKGGIEVLDVEALEDMVHDFQAE